jgi:hypothetical protein
MEKIFNANMVDAEIRSPVRGVMKRLHLRNTLIRRYLGST